MVKKGRLKKGDRTDVTEIQYTGKSILLPSSITIVFLQFAEITVQIKINGIVKIICSITRQKLFAKAA